MKGGGVLMHKLKGPKPKKPDDPPKKKAPVYNVVPFVPGPQGPPQAQSQQQPRQIEEEKQPAEPNPDLSQRLGDRIRNDYLLNQILNQHPPSNFVTPPKLNQEHFPKQAPGHIGQT